MVANKWLEEADIQDYQLQQEFWLQRLYGRKVYFGDDLEAKLAKLQRALNTTVTNLPREKLAGLVTEMEREYLQIKDREYHDY